MKQLPEVGDNKTTRAKNPKMYDEMASGPKEFGPSSKGDGMGIAKMRMDYAKKSGPVGHVPPLEKGKKADTATVALLDKLGERLAFERTGTRLYDALISKLDAYGTFSGGPKADDLQELRSEEHEHFTMLSRTITKLGGDPVAITPSADITATVSRGIGDVLADPRTSLLACLEAMLVAELTDCDGWETLIAIAHKAGQRELIKAFTKALEQERDHLERVRRWVDAGHGIERGADGG
jgi:rubrerythrin